MGTLDDMAPEQGDDSHEVDIRADLYSLGATLYKLLTGDTPLAEHAHKPLIQRLTAIATAEPTPVRAKRPEVPAELAAIVQRLLAKDPAALLVLLTILTLSTRHGVIIVEAPEGESPAELQVQVVGNGEAVEILQRDFVEVHSNDRLLVKLVEPVTRPLIIRAGEGFRPWLDVRDTPSAGFPHGLSIEGCDLDLRAPVGRQ